MKLTIFAKKRTTEKGTFYRYLTTMTKAFDGTKIVTTVKFTESCRKPKPEDCPINIVVEKGDANLVSSSYTNEKTGKTGVNYTLWVQDWELGEPFVDHSLDDFAD